ncbi:MAG: DegT/DnrJ/EryC1/StrS family aminotransferase, partial [bacterium]|nr:DegT/DnrJ/EryC1/StrS family aminotransferase [bacterium]
GQAADLERIQAICKERKITLIEDCAHALSGSFQGKKLGTFGDAAIWSFGRDKIISSVWGGMVTTNSEALTEKLRSAQHRLAYPSLLQIKQALLHPLLFALIKPLYRLKLGRLMLFLFQKAKLIPLVIFPEEKKGQCPDFMPQRLPNVLAKLALHQLKKLDRFHGHRRHCAEFYHQHLQNVPGLVLPQPDPNSAWLRYTIRCADADRLLKAARKKGIYLGDWYRSALAPEGCELGDFQYKPGSCPRAEKAARETINLPTHVQMDERRLQQVVDFVKTSCGDPRDSVI